MRNIKNIMINSPHGFMRRLSQFFPSPVYPSIALNRAKFSDCPKKQIQFIEPVHILVGDPCQTGSVEGYCGVKPVASQDVCKGDIVFQENGIPSSESTTYTVQVDEDSHLRLIGDGRFLAHSFSPNLVANIPRNVDGITTTIEFFALHNIKKGDTLSFNYCTTEWSTSDPFVDTLSGKRCGGFIELSHEDKILAMNANLLPSHILRKWIRSFF